MRFLSLIAALAIGLAASASAQTLDRIRETGEFKIGYRADAAPLSFANADGNATGYTPLLCVGIARILSEQLGLEDLNVSFIQVSAEERFDKVASGEIDLLCGAASITLGRRELVDFSDPVFVDGSVMLLPRNGSPDFKSLAGKRIGVRSGTTTATALSNTLKRAGIEAEQVPFASHDDGVLALRDGEIDAYFGDQAILIHQLRSKDLGGELRITDQLLTVEKQGLAMARGDADFRLMIDRILSELYKNGTMKRIYEEMLPGLQPGVAVRAMHMIAPTLP